LPIILFVPPLLLYGSVSSDLRASNAKKENGTTANAAVVPRDAVRLGQSSTSAIEPPAMLDADEAARLLGISREALYMRVARGQVPGVVRTGKRRIQFHRERLLTGLAKRASR